MSLKTNRLLQEAKKRASAKKFDIDVLCFEEQLKFIRDKSRFKSATCSRRAGKTLGIALDMVDTCKTEKNIICLYVTLTTKSARSIIWGDLKRVIEEYKLDVKLDETRLTIKFKETSSEIRLGGAKDEAEIEKYRGWKIRKAYVDEAQSFRPYLTYFMNDILMPALRDLRGDLIVTGTPGPILAGPFYEISKSELWSQHHWTAFDNPHMLDLERTLREERTIKGIDESDPGYIRETFGKWVEDLDSLVYKFSKERNVYKVLSPEELANMDFIFGIDIGWNDADAIAILGYNRISQDVYLVEESIKSKQTISGLVDDINRLREKYKPIKMVMDAGALGKKIQEEIKSRFGLNIEAADKHRKFEFIELLNDDLRTGKFKAKEDSRYAEDCYLVQWEKTDGGKLKISDTYHTDIGDSVLYAWRECKHYYKHVIVEKVDPHSDAWGDKIEEMLLQEMEDRANQHESDPLYDLNEDIE